MTKFYFLLCLIFCFSVAAQDIENYFKSYDNGIKAMTEKSYADAIVFFKKASKIMPHLPQPVYKIACAYSMNNDAENALLWLEKALSLGLTDAEFVKKDVFLKNIQGIEGYKKLENKFKNAPETRCPDLKCQDLQGNTVNLQEFWGKVVVLDFWATWCPPCRREIPGFKVLADKYAKQGVVIVGISREDADTIKKFAAEEKINYVMLRNTMTKEEMPSPFALIRGIPTTYMIDHNGIITKTHVGFTNKEVFEKEILGLIEKMEQKMPQKNPLVTIPDRPLMGGWVKQDVNSEFIQKIAAKATTILQKDYPDYTLVKIYKAGTQVVAGTNYYLVLEFSTAKTNVIWEVIVYEDLQGGCSITQKQEAN